MKRIMKEKRYMWAILSVLLMGMASCTKYEPLPENVGTITSAEADALSVTMSIADLKNTFDVKDSLFTINYIESDTTLYVRGRVITSDVSGNIYKYLIIQDTQTGDALKVSVDAGSLSGAFPMGQEIVINCKGLVIGRYADMAQLGVETFNTSKGRIEPGRIPYADFMSRVKYVGNPEPSKILCPVMTLEEINSRIDDATLYGRLVRINGVHFTGLGDDGEKLNAADKIFAPSTYSPTLQYSIGYPQARQIADANGELAYISTSEYARFADVELPASGVWGDVIAIVAYYRDKEEREGELQLTIRSLDDLIGFFDGTGGGEPTPDVPETNLILDAKLTDGWGGFTAYNVAGDQVWATDATYGAKMSGFANSKSNANEDWLISPALNLAGVEGAVIKFDPAINKGDVNNLTTNHTLWMSDNYSEGDPTTATWEEVAITKYPNGTSWTYTSSGDIVIPAAYLKDGVRFAFKYLCSDSESATWEIKNVVVK